MEEYVLMFAHLEVIEKWAMDVEVGHLRTPIIHLDVDIGVFAIWGYEGLRSMFCRTFTHDSL